MAGISDFNTTKKKSYFKIEPGKTSEFYFTGEFKKYFIENGKTGISKFSEWAKGRTTRFDAVVIAFEGDEKNPGVLTFGNMIKKPLVELSAENPDSDTHTVKIKRVGEALSTRYTVTLGRKLADSEIEQLRLLATTEAPKLSSTDQVSEEEELEEEVNF